MSRASDILEAAKVVNEAKISSPGGEDIFLGIDVDSEVITVSQGKHAIEMTAAHYKGFLAFLQTNKAKLPEWGI